MALNDHNGRDDQDDTLNVQRVDYSVEQYQVPGDPDSTVGYARIDGAKARRSVQGHLPTGLASRHPLSNRFATPAVVALAGALVVLVALLTVSGGAGAQEPGDATPVTMGADQVSPPAGPSDEPSIEPTEPTIVPTEPPPPTDTPTEPSPPTPTPTPTPTATAPPTETPTVSPPTGTAPPTVPPTVVPTTPPVVQPPTAPPEIAPTSPPVVAPTDEPAANQPEPDQNLPDADSTITLSDRFDDPTMRLLGETKPSDTRLLGRYEDGHYRLEIDGPEVSPDLIALVRSPILVDATIHVSAQLEGTIQDRYIMATCREVEGYGGYRAYLSPHDGYFAITRFEPGALPTILQEGPADELIQGSDRFEFEFSCTGFVLELRVNDETIGIAADNSFAAGTVSIGTGFFANAVPGPVSALFQDLEVTGNVGMAAQVGRDGRGRSPSGPSRSVATAPIAIRAE